MSLVILSKKIIFPSTDSADDDGLLAIGGDLSSETLILAYRQGIFPWYNEHEPICWWYPDPRFVLFPNELKISGSMRSVCNSHLFKFTVNKSFEEVIENCRSIRRKGQPGTWLSEELKEAYTRLHTEGFAHSAEAWKDGQLAGGLYGIVLGNVFFGESMFTKESNASKFAFIQYVKYLKTHGVQLIDCQVHSSHLESLGARMIDKTEFSKLLKSLIN
ncbi:MAG: leucyl/phenylalanyl-tRNA--protein transferase [Ginsengibacter sp.]